MIFRDHPTDKSVKILDMNKLELFLLINLLISLGALTLAIAAYARTM